MSSIEIPLGKNQFAIIDSDDLEFVMRYEWRFKTGHCNYAVTMGRNSTKLHNYIMNCPEGKVVDHRNGNGLDNRRDNLRICEHYQNVWNQKKAKNTKNRFKGVQKRGKKWSASISCRNKRYQLGVFDTEAEAAIAYNDKAKELHGDFSNINKIGSAQYLSSSYSIK